MSLAGLANLATMLEWEKKQDPDGLLFALWSGRIGDPKTDGALIAADSPVNHAAAITAPVLLMHGTKDDIVDPAQSRAMAAALKGCAGKTYTYVELPGAGHHLDEWDEKTSRTILQTSVDFLAKSFV